MGAHSLHRADLAGVHDRDVDDVVEVPRQAGRLQCCDSVDRGDALADLPDGTPPPCLGVECAGGHRDGPGAGQGPPLRSDLTRDRVAIDAEPARVPPGEHAAVGLGLVTGASAAL